MQALIFKEMDDFLLSVQFRHSQSSTTLIDKVVEPKDTRMEGGEEEWMEPHSLSQGKNGKSLVSPS
jgi:hypothetical protein